MVTLPRAGNVLESVLSDCRNIDGAPTPVQCIITAQEVNKMKTHLYSWLSCIVLSLAASGCSSEGIYDTATPVGHTTPDATPTVSPTETPTPEPTPVPDFLAPFVLSMPSCALEVGEGGVSFVVASGFLIVYEETASRLCAWGGSSDFPFYSYSCPSDLEWKTPVPNVWQAYRIETRYSPESWDEAADDLVCTPCASGAHCYGAP